MLGWCLYWIYVEFALICLKLYVCLWADYNSGIFFEIRFRGLYVNFVLEWPFLWSKNNHDNHFCWSWFFPSRNNVGYSSSNPLLVERKEKQTYLRRWIISLKKIPVLTPTDPRARGNSLRQRCMLFKEVWPDLNNPFKSLLIGIFMGF